MDSKQKLTTFQLIILLVFGFAILAGLVVFATYRAFSGEQIGPVTIWGTLDRVAMEQILLEQSNVDERLQSVTYVEKNPATFSDDFADALASGVGPDLIIISQDQILTEENKVTAFGYESFSRKEFSDTFIDEAQLFLGPDGITGLPILVDPLVLYWNRDMLSKYSFAQAPEYWDEVFTMAEAISIADSSGGISQSAIALGEARNVLHAKEIISMLITQASGNIVAVNSLGTLFAAMSTNPLSAPEIPAVSALRFYTTFANAAESVYSWNRSLPNSQDAFAQGTVGMYVGYASELPVLRQKNPNLRFSVAAVPQIRDSQRYATFGTMYAAAIPRTAPRPADSAAIASILMGSSFSQALATELSMAPVQRSLLGVEAEGEQRIFNQMALIAVGWLDPSPTDTDQIFVNMIEGVTSGRERLTGAVTNADRVLQTLLQ